MNSGNRATIISMDEAVNLGPAPEGNLAIPVFNNTGIEVELYQPISNDPQKPHDRNEMYIVISGKGEFYDGKNNRIFSSGTYIFVPAGVEHRFLNFSDDLTVWVIFFGPDGGEGA